jgi:hypothetical protein
MCIPEWAAHSILTTLQQQTQSLYENSSGYSVRGPITMRKMGTITSPRLSLWNPIGYHIGIKALHGQTLRLFLRVAVYSTLMYN